MPALFRVLTTPPYERDAQKAARRNPHLIEFIKETIANLRDDPMNLSRRYDIKKLRNVARGEGQWRIRSGDYRMRYDIIGNDVVLYSFRHRKDAYRDI